MVFLMCQNVRNRNYVKKCLGLFILYTCKLHFTDPHIMPRRRRGFKQPSRRRGANTFRHPRTSRMGAGTTTPRETTTMGAANEKHDACTRKLRRYMLTANSGNSGKTQPRNSGEKRNHDATSTTMNRRCGLPAQRSRR